MSGEIVEYRDNLVCFKYPKRLRQRDADYFYFFERPRPRKEPKIFESIEIYIDPPGDGLDTFRRQIRKPAILDKRTLGDMCVLEQSIIAQGETDIRSNAIHCVISSYHTILKKYEFRWDMLFPLEMHMVFVRINAPGTFQEYRSEWEGVIKSIDLVRSS